jgi:hypothetical protein
MNLFDTLSSYGLTTNILQVLIVGGVAVFLIGMYWRIIVAGGAIVFCVMVFAMPSGTVNAGDTNKKEFMEDCMHYEGNKVECEKIWKERE